MAPFGIIPVLRYRYCSFQYTLFLTIQRFIQNFSQDEEKVWFRIRIRFQILGWIRIRKKRLRAETLTQREDIMI